MFGGDRTKLKGQVDGLRYGDSAAAELHQRGVRFPVEPRQLGDLWYAFAEDPNGVRVELLQRPPE